METIDYFNLFVKQTEFTEITDGDFENICKNNRMSFSKLPSQEEIIEIQKQVI